jgi:CTP-dependent riboflavin kinase
MKGFYIEVSNHLLDPKHQNAMKQSVWLFMFLLDKITRIDEKGIGTVLGGKPLKFKEDIWPELGMSEQTYTRWTKNLKKHGYINTRRTPYGLIFWVNKAKKRFGRSAKNGASETEGSAKSNGLDASKMIKRTTEVAETKKTEQRQNSKTITIGEATQGVAGIALNEIISLFKELNPSYERLFSNKTERAAAERLIQKMGREKLEGVIKYVATTNVMPYAPTITTPFELERNLGKLIAFYNREKTQSDKNKIVFTS